MRRSLLVLSLIVSGCGSGDEERNESGVTIALPPALPAEAPEPLTEPGPDSNAAAPAQEAQPEPERAEPVPAPAAEKERAPAAEPKAAGKARPEGTAPEKAAPAVPKEAESATPTASSEGAGARPPLSDALIASTIRRIGYPCSSVSGTSAAGGGGYRITCSAGETYVGRLVNGHMRFRKADR